MKVSVIVPCYNYGGYVLDSINSVLLQTFSDLELILVDDGSTDNTSEIVKSIRDPRFKYLRIKNSGVSIARNTGIEKSKGEYIAFLDADDIWLPEKLELQLKLFEMEPSLGMVFSDLSRFNNEGELKETQFSYIPELQQIKKIPYMNGTAFVIAEDTFSTLGTTKNFATWVQTTVIKKNILGNIRFPEEIKLCEDYIFMMQIYTSAACGYINTPLTKVRRHNSNSYSVAEEMLLPRIDAAIYLKSRMHERVYQDVISLNLVNAYLAYAYYHFWHGQSFESAKTYIKVLLFHKEKLNALKHLLMIPLLPALKITGIIPSNKNEN